MSLLYLLGGAGAALLGFAALARRNDAAGTSGASEPDGARGPGDAGSGDATSAVDPAAVDPATTARRDERGPGDPSATTIPLRPPPPGSTAPPPTIAQWSAAMASGCLRCGIPLPYAVRWMMVESAGRPCACGKPDARGPDGYPLEMGIAQLYNPDDLSVLAPALTGAELRAYCVPGDWHEIAYKGKILRGFSQDQLRPLAPAEIQRQADATVGLIARCERTATGRLASVGAGGPGWARDTSGYWAFVKLQHGEPVLSTRGMPAVVKILGRAPRDWREFASTLPAAMPKWRAAIPIIVANAEKTASSVPDARSVS